MKRHPLYPLFCKLRPEAAGLDEASAVQPFVEFFTFVYLVPFALVGLVWLFLWIDYRALPEALSGLLILFVSLLIIQSRPATVPLQLGGNTATTMTISLGSILLWAGIFIFGPVALLVDLIVSLALRFYSAWVGSTYAGNRGWMILALSAQEITNTTLAGLVGISVYLLLQGQIPLEGVTFVEWLPALAALGVSAFFPAVVMLPVIIQINRLTNTPNTWGTVRSFIFSVVRLLLIATPFAIPLALLYTRASPAINIFATFGLVLVNLLVYYLSRTNARSRQRTREMTQLEALGEEIIQAPPDGSTLRDMLARHVRNMFQEPSDILEIRIFDGVELPGFTGGPAALHLVYPSNHPSTPDDLWQKLLESGESHIVINDVVSDGAKSAYGDAVIDKITSAAPVENGESPECIGGVYLLRHKSTARSIEALPAIQTLASQIASALYRAQVHVETLTADRMAQELAFAGNIQASFLPEEVPVLPGWELAASLMPARQTAGDFYDFIPLGGDKIGLLVADVADKGTGAALYMALSRTLIRTHAMQFPKDPAEALRLANERILADTRANQFVTVFYAVLDTKTGEIIYCNAGHNPAFIIRSGAPEAHESIIRTGPPMGIFGDIFWEEGQAQLEQGDVLLIYSDGVNEAQNEAQEFFDYDRFLPAAQKHHKQHATEIHDAVLAAVADFVGGAPQFDDITLMVLKRLG